MEAKAILRNARVSPRKARLVADLVRGHSVEEAISILTFTRKKSALLIRKLVESALANAEYEAKRGGQPLDVDTVIVRTIYVDGGPVLRRFRPRALGRATRVVKRSSHITVVLAES
jgi:large subunit ribosomal protein L22